MRRRARGRGVVPPTRALACRPRKNAYEQRDPARARQGAGEHETVVAHYSVQEYSCTCYPSAGMSKVSLDALLDDDEWAWLTASATEARLPDEGKAFRCCVNFLAQSQAADVHVAEALSASTTDAASRQPAGDHTPRTLDLAASQIEWMRSASAQSGVSSIESFASTVVQACMKVDDRTAVFGVVRCKTATASRGGGDVAGLADTSTVCAGAQEALAAQKGTS